jgi:hypothetical protein
MQVLGLAATIGTRASSTTAALIEPNNSAKPPLLATDHDAEPMIEMS